MVKVSVHACANHNREFGAPIQACSCAELLIVYTSSFATACSGPHCICISLVPVSEDQLSPQTSSPRTGCPPSGWVVPPAHLAMEFQCGSVGELTVEEGVEAFAHFT